MRIVNSARTAYTAGAAAFAREVRMAKRAKRRSTGKRPKKAVPFEYRSWDEGTHPTKRKVEKFILTPFLILAGVGMGIYMLTRPKDDKDYSMLPGRSGLTPRYNPETGKLDYHYTEETEINEGPVMVEPPVEMDSETTDIQI